MRKADLKCLISDLIVESTQLKLRNKNKFKLLKYLNIDLIGCVRKLYGRNKQNIIVIRDLRNIEKLKNKVRNPKK